MLGKIPLSNWIFALSELAVIALLAGGAFVAGRRLIGARLRGLAARMYADDRRALIAVGLIALAAAAFASAVRPGLPAVHDEFSYLLAGDTFAHGRLTNPTHPFWPHFETFHVLQQPSYQSKYPPGQGLFIAAGQALTGQPLVGVWLSLALACAALYWCLRAWTPRGWAFFGALLPAVRFGAGAYWNHISWGYWGASYWGGAVAFLGGALTLGATPRLLRRPRGRDSLLLGLGLSTLACSRPFEGFVLASLVSLLVVAGLVRRGEWKGLGRGLGPAALVVAGSLCALAYYNWRVTGSALTTPYQLYARQYDVAPIFHLQAPAEEPEYRHDVLRRYHLGFMMENYRKQQEGPWIKPGDAVSLAAFFLGPALALVAPLGLLCRDRWSVFILLSLAAAAAAQGATSTNQFRAHYFAPYAPCVVLLAVRGLRVLQAWKWRGRRLGPLAAEAVVVVCVAAFFVGGLLRAGMPEAERSELAGPRERVVQRMMAEGDRHLVLVRYAPDHNVHTEWVHNLSEIDRQAVVWAREMAPDENQALVGYYSDRLAWVLEPDVSPARLTRYAPRGN